MWSLQLDPATDPMREPPPVEAFYWIFGVIVALATMGYWLAPFVALFRPARQPARAPRLGYVRTRSLLPLPVEAALNEHEPRLRKAGFEPFPPTRDVRDLNAVRGGASGVIQLFQHPGNRDLAAVVAIPRGTGGAVSMLSFETRLADGSTLETMNMRTPSTFPTLPGVRRLRFPGELSPERLYALHRARVAESGPARAERIEDALAMVQANEQRMIDWMVECGHRRRSGDRLRCTLRGAFAGTYRLLPPWSWLDAHRNERERRRLATKARIAGSHGNERSLTSRVLFE